MLTCNVAEEHSDEREPRRIGEGRRGAGKRDDPILQGLAQRLQGVAAELGQLGERMNPVMGETHLPGRGMLPPPMRPASEIEQWGERNGRWVRRAWRVDFIPCGVARTAEYCARRPRDTRRAGKSSART
jgi:hypothetical protein